MISEKQKHALFIEIHKTIEEATVAAVEGLSSLPNLQLAYPPNGGLSDEEKSALAKLSISSVQKNALRKIVADAASYPVFHLLTLLDGVSDPGGYEEIWPGFVLEPKSEDYESIDSFLHDEADGVYWDWRKIRPSTDWKLDNFDDQL